MKRTVLALLCGAALVVSVAAYSYAEDSSADKDMADRYFQAGQAGDATAQFYLGALYSAGVGRSQSDTEAFQWFSRAAENGHAQAMLIISGLYVIGRGTPKDNVSAFTWASIAESEARIDEIRNGARQLLHVLEPRLTRDEIQQANAKAERWRGAQTRTPQRSTDDVNHLSQVPSDLRTRFRK